MPATTMQAYLDNAATTQLSAAARDAMLSACDIYGNPSSLHRQGREAFAELQRARKTIAACIGAKPGEIYFTSGGTEADNQAIASCVGRGGKTHVITSNIEHHAILHDLERLKKTKEITVTLIEVDRDGLVNPDDVRDAIRGDTCLVSVMHANNEIGTIQPIAEIGAICRAAKVPFHCDAVQSTGHIPVDVKALNVDMLSLSAHKFHGPKGVGALYCGRGTPLLPLLVGGAQERNRRAGTENLPAIAGMAAALAEAAAEMDEVSARLAGFRSQLFDGLSMIERSHLNGSKTLRLPGNVSFCFEGLEGEALLLHLDARGIAASSGSACTSGSLDPSHVLLAIGHPHEIAHGSLRLSLSRYTTQEEIDHTLQEIPKVVAYLRNMSPVWEKIISAEADIK